MLNDSTLQINPNNSGKTLFLSVVLNHPAGDMVYPATSSSRYIWQTISPLLDRNANARFEMSPKLSSTSTWNLASITNTRNNASFHLPWKHHRFGSHLYDTCSWQYWNRMLMNFKYLIGWTIMMSPMKKINRYCQFHGALVHQHHFWMSEYISDKL